MATTVREAVYLIRAAARRGERWYAARGWPEPIYPQTLQEIVREVYGSCPRVLTLGVIERLVARAPAPPSREARLRAFAAEVARRQDAERLRQRQAAEKRHAADLAACYAQLRGLGVTHDGHERDTIDVYAVSRSEVSRWLGSYTTHYHLRDGVSVEAFAVLDRDRYSKRWHRTYGPARSLRLDWWVGPDVLRAIHRGAAWARIDAQTIALVPHDLADGKARLTWTVRSGRGTERDCSRQYLVRSGRTLALGATPGEAREVAARRDARRASRAAAEARTDLSHAQDEAVDAATSLRVAVGVAS